MKKSSKVGLILLIIILQLLSPIVLLIGSFLLYGIVTFEVSPNVYVDIPYANDRLLIKESSNAFRSGASIYYVNSTGMKFYMGKTKAYGVTPFKDGRYSIDYGTYGISVKWEHRFEWEWWEEEFFYYPIYAIVN